MKKRGLFGLSVATLALVCSGITFSASKKSSAIETDAYSLPESELYVAPAATVNPAHTYTSLPTNEPWYKNSHQYHSTAQGSDGIDYERNQKTTVFDFMNVTSTWNSYRGENVKVAVIDTGCYTSHEDFSGTNIKTISKNFVSGISGLSAVNDSNGHGTTSAATIAAAVNGVGGTGIAPNVELIILKCVDANNAFSNTAIDNALQYCIDNEVDVVNMSIQGYNVSSNFSSSYTEDFGNYTVNTTSKGIMTPTQFSTKLKECHDAGITLVAAAGNFNTNKPSYPAANDYVIAVGSTGLESPTAKAGYSNYGDWVDISAPGYVYTPTLGSASSYSVTNGTSFSAPLVTGAIALYKSKYPNATPDQIEEALKATAQSINWEGGAGAVDVGAFLEYAPKAEVESLTLPDETKTLSVGETYQLNPTILPADASQEVTYGCSDDSVVSISSTGLVTGLTEGTVTVTVYSKNTSIFDTVAVTVSEETGGGGTDSSNPYKKSVFGSGSIQAGNSSYTGTVKNTTDGFTVTVTNGNNNQNGWNGHFRFGQKNNASVGKITTDSAIDKKINKVSLVVGEKCSNVNSIKVYCGSAANSISTLAGTFGEPSANSTIDCALTNTSASQFYEIQISMKSGSNGAFDVGEVDYWAEGSAPTAKTLESISLSGNYKKSFTVEESFSYEGLVVTANYSSGNPSTVTGFTVSSPNMTTAGDKTVTVSYTEGGVTKQATYTITVTAQTTTTYTVTFNANGHGSAPSAVTVNAGGTVTKPSDPSANGWTFGGWYTDSGCTNAYNFNNAVNSSFTLYAKWTQNSSSGQGVQMPADYYKDITSDLEGNELLTKLRTLNLGKRTSTVGYSNMGTSPSGSYKYTDYDPTTVKYDANGQPYGTAILSFYSGKSCTSWNREHVWPNSRGGGSGGSAGTPYPDADIFMPRPTITEENSDRGNSKYVEGIVSTTAGWDPVTAFEKTLGVYPGIRGECARIIFYCMTVNSNLVLDDTATGGTAGVTMGKLSDLLRWNLENPVNDREIRRQSGGQYLQGNRNAFVDEPAYACKIWGNYNDSTRQICSQTPVGDKTLVDLEVSGTLTKTSFYSGESFSPTGLTINAIFDDNSSIPVTNLVTWSPTKLTTDTTSVTGSYTLNGVTKTVTIDGFTVTASPTSSLTKVTSMSQLSDGDLVYLATGLTDTDVGVTGQSNKDATVSSLVSSWKQYTVVKSGTTYTLKDGTQYIANPGRNEFKYGTTGGAITLDSSSNMKVGSRWFVKNGSNYRCYTSLGSYIPFHIYKVPVQTEPKVTNITLDPTSLSFDVYNDMNSKTITATVTADEGADKTILWSSSDPSVATVENGIVTPHAKGSATISAKAGTITKTCSVTVNDSTPKVTGLTLSPTSLTFDVYNNMNPQTITATVTADTGADKTVTWTSSNESVATVSGGVVTPHAKGSATITAQAGTITKTCSVTVNDSTPAAVSGVTLNKGSTTLVIGSSETLIATVNPPNAGNKNVTWSTNNPSVATVSNGTVNAIAAGTATITVTTEEGGYTATCTVTVTSAPAITYQLEADKTIIPYMSGTNHQVSIGVSVYKYSNGIKGELVKSGSSTVDTSILGVQKISYIYESLTIYGEVKVTNDGAELQPSSGGGSVTIKNTDVGLPSSGYKEINYTDKVTNSSFTGVACKASDGTIQLKSKENVSGIVQTVSPGKLAKITITFANIGNGVEIYGSNTTYTGAGDLYNDSTKGTKLATITSNGVSSQASADGIAYPAATTTKEVEIKGDYKYFGIKSVNGAITISSFKVDYASSGVSDEAAINQALAWSEYFVRLTRTDSTCLAKTDDEKFIGLKDVWNELKNEYNEMEPLSKDKFCNNGDSEVIKHYQNIISKFGKSSKYGKEGLEDFVKDSNDQPLAMLSYNVSFLPINKINNSAIVTIALSFLGTAAIGFYFVKKRKNY